VLGAPHFSTSSSGASQITWSTPRRIQHTSVCRGARSSSSVHIILNRADHLLLEGILLPRSPSSEAIDDQVRGDLLYRVRKWISQYSRTQNTQNVNADALGRSKTRGETRNECGSFWDTEQNAKRDRLTCAAVVKPKKTWLRGLLMAYVTRKHIANVEYNAADSTKIVRREV
jgi:hypothetical protein